MSRTILVGVAWPYANGDAHLGHLAGVYVPCDIYARYQRLRGNRVLMVSGSDAHGTPITLRADQEGVRAREVFLKYHHRFLETWQALRISFDLYTHTDTRNHHKVSQDIFLRLLAQGYLFKLTQKQMYSVTERRFLPDRYVEGTCPHCGNPRARGDQCERCGKLLDPFDLIDPRSRSDGSRPEIRETEHYFLDLPAIQAQLEAWLREDKEFWRPNVINFTKNYVESGLLSRAFTRDIDWGVPVPLSDQQDKVLYVFFEAVIGYLSATIEWAHNTGQPDAWKEWWYNPQARTLYFIGKDNIPFHTIIWPAELIGAQRLYEDDPRLALNLPYDVPANEFMNLEGEKFSTSGNWAIWAPDFLARYDPDPLRYYLTINAPEGKDTDFSWADFIRRNNDELVAAWGNLVNRVLTFTYRNFSSQVPEPGPIRPQDEEILGRVSAGFATIGDLIDACKFRAALLAIMAIVREANRYLDDRAPWFEMKTDRTAAATTLYTAIRVIDGLKTLLLPFLPFSSSRLHHMLGYDTNIFGNLSTQEIDEGDGATHIVLTYRWDLAGDLWQPGQIRPGQRLEEPQPLFTKLAESIAREEIEKLKQARRNHGRHT
ncbi:MAG: methionine--tRNA ligase [Chloroflexi bacterium]|nr:methionine--tRNA ligase [Chloroflexota bacterium]